MPRQLALLCCILFIVWLFVRDRKLRPMTSAALWVSLAWILIVGSRPVSYWFSGSENLESPDGYLEGSSMDRNVFLLLLAAGLILLLRRKIDWAGFFSANRWFCAFFLYFLVSVVWSDYPFVGMKRWIKDAGNVVILLIILTEKDPVRAVRAVFHRFAYVVVPLSVVFIKYFGDIGRYYNPWTWEPTNCGITYEKNSLGPLAFICGLFLVWDLIDILRRDREETDRIDVLNRVLLLLMVLWLIDKAHSATALVCLVLGVAILLLMQLPSARRQARRLGTYAAVLIALVVCLYAIPGVLDMVVSIVGRDLTFTGRTDVWADLLKQPINPLLGTGYQNFWLGPRAEVMWEKYYFHPNQAHNGYLETYLNGGMVGLFLLLGLVISIGNSLKKELLAGNDYGILRFSFYVVALFSNWTEATFNKQSLVWLITIIAALKEVPMLPVPGKETAKIQSDTPGAFQEAPAPLPPFSQEESWNG